MSIFHTILAALELNDAYLVAQSYYADPENLKRYVLNEEIVDDGAVLDSSLTSVQRFATVTDALMDHVNHNLDTIPGADDILDTFLNTEVVAANRFVPHLTASSIPTEPGALNLSCIGTGLSIGFWVSETVNLTPDSTMEGILDAEERLVFRGHLEVFDNDTLRWTPEAVAESFNVTLSDTLGEPELPTVEERTLANESYREA